MKYFLLCSVIFYFSCNNNIDSNNQVNKTPIKKENNFVDNNLGNDDELDPSRYISKGKEHAEKANQTIKNVKDKMLKGALLDTAVNNLDKAANNLNIASKLDSSNGNTHYLLAKTYFHLMRVKSKDKKDSRSHAILAEEYFEKAILHNCDSTYFALQRLAVVKKDLDKKEESVEILKKCLSLEAPSKLDEQRLYFLISQFYMDIGDVRRKMIEEMIHSGLIIKNIEKILMIQATHKANQFDTLAINYYNAILEINSKNIDAMYGKGLFYQNEGRYSESQDMYYRIKDIDPFNINATFNLGFIHMELHNYRISVNYFSDVIVTNKDYYKAYYARGICYEKLGDIINAERDYRTALRIFPDYQDARSQLNNLLTNNEKYK